VAIDTDAFSFGRAMMQDIMQALPGIDEAMSYSEVMKFVDFLIFRNTYLSETVNADKASQ